MSNAKGMSKPECLEVWPIKHHFISQSLRYESCSTPFIPEVLPHASAADCITSFSCESVGVSKQAQHRRENTTLRIHERPWWKTEVPRADSK